MTDPPFLDGPEAAARSLTGPYSYSVLQGDLSGTMMSDVLGDTSGVPYPNNATFIKYRSATSITSVLQHKTRSSSKLVEYNVGVKANRVNIQPRRYDGLILNGTIVLDPLYQADITHASSRNPALPSDFKTADLLGVAERLQMGISHYQAWGALTVNELKGGAPWDVRSVTAATDNIAVDPSSVYVSRRNTDYRYPAAMCALFAAINGETGTVYTDLVEIDATGVVNVKTFSNDALARGCHEALRMIMSMYIDAGQGPACALAITRGEHKISTVAGHSDEGGHVRAVLRRGCYRPPHGVVLLGNPPIVYTGMTTPGAGVGSFRRYCHSIALGTAAASAVADPMPLIGGQRYPTVISELAGDQDDAGKHGVDVDAEGRRVPVSVEVRTNQQRRWAVAAQEWAVNYTYALGKFFKASGSTSLAIMHLVNMADDAVGIDDDHLRRPTAVAFFWIEPTSIWSDMDFTLPAIAGKCGPLAVAGTKTNMPLVSGLTAVQDVGGGRYTFDCDFRYMRRHGLFLFCDQNRLGGMSDIHLFSGSVDRFANVGGPSKSMEDRILGADPMSTLAWGRLHNQFVAVGEVINTNVSLRFKVDSYNFGRDDEWNVETNNVPTASELDGYVSLETGKPSFAGMGQLVVHDACWNRARSGAAKALQIAASRHANGSEYGTSIRPTLGEPGPVCYGEATRTFMDSGKKNLENIDEGDTGIEQSDVASVPVADVATNKGNFVPIVIHNVADKGRRGIKPGRAGGGAGGGVQARANVQDIVEGHPDDGEGVLEAVGRIDIGAAARAQARPPGT